MYLLNWPRCYYNTAVSLDQFQLKWDLLHIGPNDTSVSPECCLVANGENSPHHFLGNGGATLIVMAKTSFQGVCVCLPGWIFA